MRVEQQNQILEAMQKKAGTEVKTAFGIVAENAKTTKSVSGKQTSVQMKDTTYANPAKEEKKSIAEKIEESSEMDAFDRKNQMAVLSNTASEEDYAKMQEEGFSLDSTDSHTIITVTDKIKMQLAKAGKEVFGDDLDAAELEAMTGSAALASQLEQAFKDADLPATDDNIAMSVEAFEQLQMLQPMTDGAIKYMLDNQLQPTIENLYMAQFSGSAAYAGQTAEDMEELSGQIQSMLVSMGLPVNENTMADCQWLIQNEIPLTEENLTYYEDLKALQFPMDASQAMEQIADAITAGNMPKDAMVAEGYSLKDQAQRAADVINNATEEDVAYVVNHDMELTVDNLAKAAGNRGKDTESGTGDQNAYTDKGLELLTAKRQLEEARLAMSAEANYALLKKGISIDTEPLVRLVDELKNMENQYYANLLEAQGAEASPENVALFAETAGKVEQLGQVPAYVLGIPDADVSTIEGAYEQGSQMKSALEKAGEQYETLMTAPRADMGDSIQKAFRNVDDILKDLGIEATEDNRRAVRILGYNGIDITEESILQMKAADEEVQRMFKNMTPAVVTQLIKQGINPLEMKISDLNRVAEQIKTEVSKDENQKFSEYLYKLEKNNQITEEERSSYIGIYRLIHQVEQTDGAAIGALVNQGAEMTMKNLLTAVRSSHKTGRMDISVNDDYGETETQTTSTNSITDQIETAYQTNCMRDASDFLTPGRLQQVFDKYPDWQNMTPEEFARALAETADTDAAAESEYLQEQMQMVQKAAAAPDEIYRILEQFDLPNTALNVNALNAMMTNRNQLFRQIFGEESTSSNRDKKITAEDIEAIKEDIIEDFGEAVSEPEALAEVQETLGKVAENVMKTMISSDEVTSIDVREMRLMQAKLSINQALSKKEQYSIPVLVGDKVTNVSLKIVRGVETKGIVDVMLESEMAGKIAATFQAKEEGISGLVVTDRQETRDLLADQIGNLAASIQEGNTEPVDLRVAVEKALDLNHFSGVATGKSGSTTSVNDPAASANEANKDGQSTEGEKEDSVYKVQTARLYHIAEAFLKTIREFE